MIERMQQEYISCIKTPRLWCNIIHDNFQNKGIEVISKFLVGNSVYHFLQKVLELLRREFSELKTVMADQLMYVKEDLILPHHYTFYDFIVTKVSCLYCFL